jgi:hypothetical protein
VNGQPGNWRSGITSAAMTVLGAAIALFIAVRLIEIIAPVLIIASVLAVFAWTIWYVHRRRGW